MYQEIYNSIKRLFTEISILDELEIDKYDDDFKKCLAIACIKADANFKDVTRVITSNEKEKIKYIFIQAKEYNSFAGDIILYNNDNYLVIVVGDNILNNKKIELFVALSISNIITNYISKIYNCNYRQVIDDYRLINEITTFDRTLIYSNLIFTMAISDEILNGQYNDFIINDNETRKILDLSWQREYMPTKNTIISAIKILRECNYDIDLLLDKGLLSTTSNETYKDLFYYHIEEKEKDNADTSSNV